MAAQAAGAYAVLDASVEVDGPQTTPLTPGTITHRAREVAFEIMETKVRGFRLAQFLALGSSLVLPVADAWLDWAIVIKWYLQGDVHWAEVGLAINLVNGVVSGLWLGGILDERQIFEKNYRLGLLLGVAGLAPVAVAALALHEKDVEQGPARLKYFKGAELVFEALPQSILQTYVGVSYGRFSPSSPKFNSLLPVSVFVSLLGAGFTFFGFEVEGRKGDREPVFLGSRYGIVAVLLHTAQAAALIFWIALVGCAYKGGAWWALVLSVAVFGGMVRISFSGDDEDIRETALVLSALHLGLVGGMVAVFSSAVVAGWVMGAMGVVAMVIIMVIIMFVVSIIRRICDEHIDESWMWRGCLFLIGILILLYLSNTLNGDDFATAEHVDNNYANKSMPVGGPNDPQYFDCHERTCGLYPAYLATALCVVLTPLYTALDPEYGIEDMRGKNWGEKNAEEERKMRAEVVGKLPLEEQVEAMWKWIEQVAEETDDGQSLRIIKHSNNPVRWKDEYCDILREMLGAEPLRGPRAVLGGRGGTVIAVGQDHVPEQKGKIQVRWEDDRTESPDVKYGDNPIKVSELDEPLGEGSAVRHNGRRGTISALDNRRDQIWVRWEDDGKLTDESVSWLDVEVTVGREAFAVAYARHPESEALIIQIADSVAGANRAVLDAKIAAVWRWADSIADGELGCTELQRLADHVGRYEVMVAMGLQKPIRAVRVALGGRVGVVIKSEEDHGDIEVKVRWEDDGTESPSIKVSELDEPLGEGRAVRYKGRRGTTVTEPFTFIHRIWSRTGMFSELHHKDIHNAILIRWENDVLDVDGSSDVQQWGAIEVDDLDFDIPDGFSLTQEAFAELLRAQEPDTKDTADGRRSGRAVDRWFEKLRLPLVLERSCLDDLCL